MVRANRKRYLHLAIEDGAYERYEEAAKAVGLKVSSWVRTTLHKASETKGEP